MLAIRLPTPAPPLTVPVMLHSSAVFICVFVGAHRPIFVYIYICTFIFVYMYLCACVCVYVCVSVSVCFRYHVLVK